VGWWIVLGSLLAGTTVVLYAVFIERRWYRLVRRRLDILPAGPPLDILHLSDLHMTAGDERKHRFIASLPEADITVVTGDMVGEPEAVEDVVHALDTARGRLASYFVLGSNDIYAPRPLNYLRYFIGHRRRKRRVGRRGRGPELVRQLEARGWMHLENLTSDLRASETRLEVGGMDDPHIHRADITGVHRKDPEAFGLAVVHSPDPAPELVALGYDLVVAGHTHGGQVRLPGFGALVTNSPIPRWMARGVARVGTGFVHVSPGMGTSKYAPFRLFCRPEATLLELRPA